jgi:hypothetical protein
MHRKPYQFVWPAAAAVAALAGSASLQAQSADALIDKLVDKGILTVKEAKDLREESDKDFSKAYQAKSGMSDWVTSLKFNGDFRGRFEQNSADNAEYTDRNRYRMRFRLGMTASLWDNFDVGLRLATGNPATANGNLVGGLPITANQDLNSLESRKFIWVDAAYAKWNAISSPNGSLTAMLGKFDNPFQLSPMVWDADIVPEGAAITFSLAPIERHTIKGIAGFFVMDELNQRVGAIPGLDPNSDPYVYGAQLIEESKWTDKFETSIGVAAFNIADKESLTGQTEPYYNSGSTRKALPGLAATLAGPLKYDMNPIIGSFAATYKLDSMPLYPDKFPIKVHGEYMYNPAAPDNNSGWRAGLTLGKAGKKKTWEINYRYQFLEADAWFDALVDDDNGAFYATGNKQLANTGKGNGWFGGTNVRGHLITGTYNFTDYMNFTFMYYLNDLIIDVPGKKSDASHFMADLMWKF